ncbi:hypothetical protein D9M71_612710 [compost metagenome]
MAAWGERVEHLAAAQCALGALIAQHQAVAVHGLQRRVEQQLGKHALAGSQAFAFEQGDSGRYILGAEVHMHSTEMFESTLLVR